MAPEPAETPFLIFDLNETLLDLSEVRKAISTALKGGEDTAVLWFETLLHYSLVASASDRFEAFGDIGATVLSMMAQIRGIKMDAAEARRILEPIRSAPPFPEVLAALERFSRNGFRMAVLTNSPTENMETQLESAGIHRFFTRALSVEDIALYKPHRHVYLWAAHRLQVSPGECLFVAAHGWDVAGALSAGMKAAFLSRPGQVPYPLAPAPDFSEPDLDKLYRTLSGSGGGS
ncbi:MAG: haloacid dehalogenase type II [Balneolaceae bacterium]